MVETLVTVNRVGAPAVGAGETDVRTRLDSFSNVKKFLANLFSGESQEIVYIISLNNSYRLLGYSAVYTGNVNHAVVDIKPMVRSAISHNASHVILAHNHPDGIAIPSDSDIESTKRIDILFKQIGIDLVDHFIVAGDRCTPIMHTENLKISI